MSLSQTPGSFSCLRAGWVQALQACEVQPNKTPNSWLLGAGGRLSLKLAAGTTPGQRVYLLSPPAGGEGPRAGVEKLPWPEERDAAQTLLPTPKLCFLVGPHTSQPLRGSMSWNSGRLSSFPITEACEALTKTSATDPAHQ